MKREDFPNFGNFMGAYFNQDWKLDFSSGEEVLSYYIKTTSPKYIRNTIKELEEFLSLNLDEKELEHFLIRELGCNYDPEPEMTYSEWLKEVLKILKSKISEKKSALEEVANDS